jgi:hypothetical protein
VRDADGAHHPPGVGCDSEDFLREQMGTHYDERLESIVGVSTTDRAAGSGSNPVPTWRRLGAGPWPGRGKEGRRTDDVDIATLRLVDSKITTTGPRVRDRLSSW